MSWVDTTLGALIELQRGHDLPVQSRRAGPVPVVGANGVLGSHSEAKYDGPGVLIGRSGIIGGAIFVRDPYWPLNTTLFVKDFRGNDPRWTYYLLKSIDFSGYNSGSVQPSLNRNYIADVELTVPDLEEQRAIARLLGALDDKIGSNVRIMDRLDGLLHAKWRETSDQAGETRYLGDLVSTQYGLTASAEAGVEGPRFVRVTDINKTNWVSWSSVPSARIPEADWAKYRLHKGDLVVARMADPGKSAIYDDESVDAVFASYLVRLRAATYAESLYLYGFLKSMLYADFAAGAMTGSVQKNMNAKVIVDVQVPWPDASGIERFADFAAPLRATINQLVSENRRLGDLRDALLPELLSGRRKVRSTAKVPVMR